MVILIWDSILVPSWLHFPSKNHLKIIQKSTINRWKNGVQYRTHLGVEFSRNLVDFWCQVGPKTAQDGTQKGFKIVWKRMPEMNKNLSVFWSCSGIAGVRFWVAQTPWFHNTRRTFFDALTDPRSGGGRAGILADFLGGRGRFWKIFWEGQKRFLSILVYIFCNIFASRFLWCISFFFLENTSSTQHKNNNAVINKIFN